MKIRSKEQGFTLIELLLVVVIIGILLAVIVPRAWRANVDAKYGLVRQNCSELASFASLWAEQQMEAQNLDSTARLTAYFNSLTRPDGTGTAGNGGGVIEGQWIANPTTSNWKQDSTNRVAISGRYLGPTGTDVDVETSVEGIIPVERIPRNPFDGTSVFIGYPDGSTVLPGAIAAGRAGDDSQSGNWNYYAFVFQGTDSTTTDLSSAGEKPDVFHAGMDITLAGLRNGVFMARLPYQD